MREAIIFLAVFFVALAATLAYADLPPGKQIYEALNVPTTDYPVPGIQTTTLMIAVFNGVVYGISAWLTYTTLQKRGIIKQKTNPKPVAIQFFILPNGQSELDLLPYPPQFSHSLQLYPPNSCQNDNLKTCDSARPELQCQPVSHLPNCQYHALDL